VTPLTTVPASETISNASRRPHRGLPLECCRWRMVGRSRPYAPRDDVADLAGGLALTPATRSLWRGHAGVMRRPWSPAARLGRGGHAGEGTRRGLPFRRPDARGHVRWCSGQWPADTRVRMMFVTPSLPARGDHSRRGVPPGAGRSAEGPDGVIGSRAHHEHTGDHSGHEKRSDPACFCWSEP
jgi:hypothetical protein